MLISGWSYRSYGSNLAPFFIGFYCFGGCYTEISKENEDTPTNNSFFLEARDEFAIFTDLLTDPTPFQIHPQPPDLLLKLWALVLPGSQGSTDPKLGIDHVQT
jgi:hypothetical protein